MAIELRNHRSECRPCRMVGKAIRSVAITRVAYRLAESKTQRMHANSLHGNREIPGATGCHPQSVRSRKACGRNLDMYATGKSD
jgi:hypothetical protein